MTVEVDGYYVDIYRNGKVEIATSNEGNPPEEENLAKKVLVVDLNGNEDYEKSPYVTYNDILCRVFYNDNIHGLQIISVDNEGTVTLGSDNDFNEAKNGYNNAVDTLNNKAKEYMSGTDRQEETANKIVTDARSLGSIATLKDGKFQEDPITETEYENSNVSFLDYNKQFKVADDNSEEDADQLKKLGLNATSSTWLASRFIDDFSTALYFYVRYMDSDRYIKSGLLCYIYWNGDVSLYSVTNGFRPVFLLSSNVKIKSGGDGTEDNPYELEI